AAAVVEQVVQLVGDVAVVDVERRHPGAEGAQHGLDVLVAVVEVDAEVVLAGLVPGQRVPLGVGPEPPRPQVGAEPGAAVDHLGEGQPPVPPDQALAVGVLRGDRVEGVGQVELRVGLFCPPRAAQDTRLDVVSETLAPAAGRRCGATGTASDGAPPTSRPAGPRWTWWSAGP